MIAYHRLFRGDIFVIQNGETGSTGVTKKGEQARILRMR
jgi:hypothetical protein